MMKRCNFLALGLLIGWCNFGVATDYQDMQSIKQAVQGQLLEHLYGIYDETTVQNDIEITVSNLDSRLSLSQCTNELETELKENSYGGRNMSVKVSCTTGSRWTIYVPAAVDIYVDVAVSSRNLQKGEQVQPGDFSLKRTNTSRIGRQFFDSAPALIGKEVRRTIRSGAVIRPQDVQQPELVKRGDTVILTAKSGSLTVTSNGTAMASGRLGEQIKVMNTQSKRVIDAVVSGPGHALVNI